MSSTETAIPVAYRMVSGKHFFTAAGAVGQGLCVAHCDLEAAYSEVGQQLNVIMAVNHEMSGVMDFQPSTSFQDFKSRLNGNGKVGSGPSEIEPQGQLEWVPRKVADV